MGNLILEEKVSRLPSGRWVQVREFSPDEWAQFRRRMSRGIKMDDEGNIDMSESSDNPESETETMRVFVRAYSVATDKSPKDKPPPKEEWKVIRQGIHDWEGEGKTFHEIFPNVIDRQLLQRVFQSMHVPSKALLDEFLKSDFTIGGGSPTAPGTASNPSAKS